jgi:hypothetical protein
VLHKWLWNSVWLVINILLFAIWLCGVLASTEGLLVESLVQLTMQAPQTQQQPSSNQPTLCNNLFCHHSLAAPLSGVLSQIQ